jgi:hypothetical protein
MRKTLMAFVVAATLAFEASAQSRRDTAPPPAGTRYSLLGGETVGAGVDVVSGEFGWPGISFGYTRGTGRDTDIGARFDLLFGFEEVSSSSQFGIGFRVPLRMTAFRRDRISVLLHIDPGIKLYTTTPAAFGFQFPIGATLGYAATRDLVVAFGVDMPLTALLTPDALRALYLAPTFGPAVEFHVDPRLTAGLNTRFGPVITTAGGGSQFGFVTQLLLAYRM